MNKRILFAMQVIRIWVPLAFLATCLCVIAYGVGQQGYRQGANDPQVQMADQIAGLLNAGAAPNSVIPQGPQVDLARSLGTFVAVYDANGKPLASNASLDNAMPALPPGVFLYASAVGQDRVTWQPQRGIREALVILPYSGGSGAGFVAVGRSLREVEWRVERLGKMILACWFGTLAGLLVLVALSQWLRAYLQKHHA